MLIRMMNRRSLVFLALAVTAFAVSISAKPKFSNVYTSPDAKTASFAGKKIAAMVIDKDESLRVAGEEALADELTKRGMQGVPSYRLLPKELLSKPAEAKAFVERAGVDGVVAFRAVNAAQQKVYVPATWSTDYYTSFWGYYGYGWGTVYTSGYTRDERFVSVETLIFSVSKNQLLWAGLSTDDDPKKTPRKVIEDVVKEAAKEIEKMRK
jgi:hypothetical protein